MTSTRARSRPPQHRVVVLALPGVVAFDLAVPCNVFGMTRLADGSSPYRVRVCAPTKRIDAGYFHLAAPHGLAELGRADTVVVPGIEHVERTIAAPVLEGLRRAHARGARIASVCSGAFVLAAAGLLDGRRATTHWIGTAYLAKKYPNVQVDPDVLYVGDDGVFTSAGAAAGLDLCLHLVRRDLGATVAAEAARLAVMPLEREGGQAQFIRHVPPIADDASLEPLLRWLEASATRDLTLRAIASHAAMSARSLTRHFRAQVGMTPMRYLTSLRVRRAQRLLETTGSSLERIAELSGFGSTATFRDRFRREVGTSPRAYRRTFRAAS